MTEDNSFISRVQSLVESQDFFDTLTDEISKIDNSTNRAKLMLELINYVSPKMKTQDADVGKQGAEISIVFSDAVRPENSSES